MWLVSTLQVFLLLCACVVSTESAKGRVRARSCSPNATVAASSLCYGVPGGGLLPDVRCNTIASARRLLRGGFTAYVESTCASSSSRRWAIDFASFLCRNKKSLSPRHHEGRRRVYSTLGSGNACALAALRDVFSDGLSIARTAAVAPTAAAGDVQKSWGGASFLQSTALQGSPAGPVEQDRAPGSPGKADDSSKHSAGGAKVIAITPKAKDRLRELRAQQNSSKDPRQHGQGLFLRLGVQSGGCSGLSYVLDIIDKAAVASTDVVEEFRDENEESADFITVVIDPKSLLYLVGTLLDYSDDLIGGGFKVSNPNAVRSCGCGMSFGVPKTFAQSLIDSKPRRCSLARKPADDSVSAPRWPQCR